jgi:hypothetical protein
MMEAFISAPDSTGFVLTQLITSSGTATFYPVAGPDVKISVRSAAVYYAWGKKGNTTPTNGTAATQMDWLPQNAVVRLGKPSESDGIWILQDTGAAQVYMTPGRGI